MILSLGLGIGANTVVYSLLDGVVLHPFAFPDPERMVAIGVTFPKVSNDRGFIESLSPHEFVDVRDGVPSLERVAACAALIPAMRAARVHPVSAVRAD